MLEEQQEKSQKKQPFVLQFASTNRPNRIHSLNRLNYIEDHKKDGTFVAKKDIIEHELFSHHIVQNNIKLQNQLKKLHASFIYEKVPEFYAYFFMNQLIHASQQKIQDHIFRETQELKGKRSYYHVISTSIKARQGCLKQLQKCLENLFNNQDDNITKHVFRQQIIHYRKLTGFAIAHIRSWKQYLRQISPEIDFISYFYKGQDYLQKVMMDCEYLFNSFLAKDLKFSYKNDPYLIRPYLDSNKQARFYDLFSFDEDQKAHYLTDINFLAEERAKYLQTKMNSKSQKIKEIEKIYNYKQNPMASKIFIKKLHFLDKNNDSNHINSEEKITSSRNIIKIDNFISSNQNQEKKFKLEELSKKADKMKNIKELYKKRSLSQQRLTANQFLSASESNEHPFDKKLRYTQLNPKFDAFEVQNTDRDFQNMVRKKQLKILETYSPAQRQKYNNKTQSQKLSRTIKINDEISQSRSNFMTKDEGAVELQKVLMQLQKLSPQKLDSYRLNHSSQDQNLAISKISLNESKISGRRQIDTMKTSRVHNEEVFIEVRNKVIEEIEREQLQKDQQQTRKREQNIKIQQILQKKIDQQGTRVIHNSRAKDLQGRQQLAQQFQTSELFGYTKKQKVSNNSQKLSLLEQELKKQMQLKWLRQVQSDLKHRVQMQQLQESKRNDQNKLTKQFKKVKEKQQRQKRFQQIERQQRALAEKKILELDEQRKKQIEDQMKIIIQNERQKMQKFAMIQKMQMQEELREVMKQGLLASIKKEKQKYYDDQKKQEELKFAENKYRDEVREKIERQYDIGIQMKKNKEREQQKAKVRLVKQRLQNLDKKTKASRVSEAQNQEMSPIKGLQKQKSQVPSLNSQTFVITKSPEKQKKKLREQFQLQLFSFRTPQDYSRIQIEKSNQQSLEQNPIQNEDEIKLLRKDFKLRIDEKINQQKVDQEQQSSQKNSNDDKMKNNLQIEDFDEEQQIKKEIKKQSKIQKIEDKDEYLSEKFTRFSEPQAKIIENNEDELIRLKLGMSMDEYLIYKKKKNAISAKRDIQEWQGRKKEEQDKKKVVRVIDQFEKLSGLSSHSNGPINDFDENQAFQSEKSVIQVSNNSEKVNKVKQQPIENVEIMTANSRLSSIYKKHFITSESQIQEENQMAFKKKKKSKSKSPKKKSPHRQQPKQEKGLKNAKKASNNQQVIKPIKVRDQEVKKTMAKIRQVPINKLKEFLDDHFENLPKVIKKINIYKKQQLIKVLLQQHNSFAIVEYIKDSLSLGFAIFVHNQNKTKYRSLNIIHLGVYDESETDFLQVFLNTIKLVMKKDPCEQVALSIIYDKQINYQFQFIQKLEKVFDPYGAIFQKKIFNSQFQRKLIMRRPLGLQFTQNKLASNLGTHQIQVDFLITEQRLSDYDDYEILGKRIGCYGLAAHYLSKMAQQQKLGQLIKASTTSKSPIDKHLGYLSKLSLAMKVHENSIRLEQIVESEYSDIMALNLQLIKKKKDVVSYPPEKIEEPNKSIWMSFKQQIQFPYNFYAQIIKIKLPQAQKQDENSDYLCKYLRLTPPSFKNQQLSNEKKTSKNRMYTIKSSVYSTKVHILPCKNNAKYKIFLLDSEQYDTLQKPVSLDIYMRVLFANLERHDISSFQHVWIPQIQTNAKLEMNQFEAIVDNSAVLRSKWNFTYTDYVGNSLKLEPTHRDLLITPPFIFGILNMQIEKIMEGSPIYIQKINKQDLSYLKEIQKIRKESD